MSSAQGSVHLSFVLAFLDGLTLVARQSNHAHAAFGRSGGADCRLAFGFRGGGLSRRLVRGDLSSSNIETLLTFPLLDDPISLAFDPTVVAPIPAASTWGLVAFVLLLLAMGTLVLAKRTRPRTT